MEIERIMFHAKTVGLSVKEAPLTVVALNVHVHTYIYIAWVFNFLISKATGRKGYFCLHVK